MQSTARIATLPPVESNERYAGYREADFAQPYAKYMKSHTDPAPARVDAAIANGPVDPALIPPRSKLADDLLRPGYSPVETGYGRLPGGQIWVACLTDMPRVEPEMWDWWFAWHSLESARYKLWHPDGHLFSSLAGVRPETPGEPDWKRYVGSTSYVDEVIGGNLDELAIRFKDPATFGIDTSTFDGTAVSATVGTALLPVNIGMVCHQIRRIEGGSEMRSRFYLNVPSVRKPHLRGMAQAVRRGIALPKTIKFDVAFGAQLLRHCGEEMNHLAQFLPELYAEFS